MRVARPLDSPRLTEVLRFMGPTFRPVSTSEIAEQREIKQRSAAKLVGELVTGSPAYRAPQGGLGFARKLAKHLWAITDTGQEFLCIEQNADAAYLEWLSVLTDTLSGEPNEAAFALDALRSVNWNRRHLEHTFEWQSTALQVVASLCRSCFVQDEDPSKPALDGICHAVFAVRTGEFAEPGLEIVGEARELLEERGHNRAARRLVWAERHMKLVLHPEAEEIDDE